MPTIKYKDPVTGEYKSDIHVVGAVSSVNGKTGVVELTNSDIPNAITDVQINGASVVTDGVASIPQGGYRMPGVFGVTGTPADWGVNYTHINGVNMLVAETAPNNKIDARSGRAVINPSNLDYAVKAAMCDGKGAAWTPTEQAAARERMGDDRPYENVIHAELTEDVTIFAVDVDFSQYTKLWWHVWVINSGAVQVVRVGWGPSERSIQYRTHDSITANYAGHIFGSIEPLKQPSPTNVINYSISGAYGLSAAQIGTSGWSWDGGNNKAPLYSYYNGSGYRFDEIKKFAVSAASTAGRVIESGAVIEIWGIKK